MSFALCYTIVGFIFYIWLVSKAYTYYTTTYSPSIRFQEVRYELKKFATAKHVSPSIRERILNYCDFCYKDKHFRRKEIYKLLQNDVKLLIAEDTSGKLLMQHDLFNILPPNLLRLLSMVMSEAVYMKNDIICRNDNHKGQVRNKIKAYETETSLKLLKQKLLFLTPIYFLWRKL